MLVPADSGDYITPQFADTNGQPIAAVAPIEAPPLGLATIIGRIVQHSARRQKLSPEERGRAEGRAEANRHMNEQLAVISHELRNFVCVIRNASRLMESSQRAPPVTEKARLIIDRQVGQMARLIDDLLEISLVGSGRLCLRCERTDLRVVARHAVESLEPEIALRNQRLTVALSETPVWLQADPARLMQVLLNLLGNAAKYTDTGGKLWLSVERKASQATVRVRDSGIGIAGDFLPYVFDAFMQAKSALSRSEMGIGIGLSMVKSLVELHGGRVTAASAGLGHGSEFTIHLPATSS